MPAKNKRTPVLLEGGSDGSVEVYRPPSIAKRLENVLVKSRKLAGQPRFYDNKEELEAAILDYFDEITDDNGDFVRPPSWLSLGAFLGFSSKQWGKFYVDTEEFGPTLAVVRDFIDQWRIEQVMVPSANVNPNGIMFLLNRKYHLQDQPRDPGSTTLTGEQKRPKEALALIDDIWSKKDIKHE